MQFSESLCMISQTVSIIYSYLVLGENHLFFKPVHTYVHTSEESQR